MKYILLSLCLAQALLAPISGEDIPVRARGAIPFWIDRAGFDTPDSLNYGELYLQCPCQHLTFSELNDHQRADYRVEATFFSKRDSMPFKWEKQIVTDAGTDLRDQMITEALSFRIAPGTYRVHIRLKDLQANAEGTCELAFTMPEFDNAAPTISDIQFAHRIDAANTQTTRNLVKNGFKIVPNARRSIATTLNIYFELYGLATGEGRAATFDLAYALLDTAGQRIKNFPSARYRKPGATTIKTESLDLQGVTPGQYVLKITARDNGTGKMTTRQRAFSIQKPALATDPASLKRYYKQIRYIATKTERETYDTLSAAEKVEFILTFWKKRDPTPLTPENEFATEHFRRIRYADEHFSARPGQKGSDTDQGRIHIKYGLPTDIERNPFSATGKAFEIWTYEHLNYYEFVFLDRLGDGVYEMIHATMPGERYNPNWRDQQAIGDQTDPTSLPAEAFSPP
ncbi:MAG: GWxTD domain-containing protein [Gemmatimonadetes bacterium]|nr:GWxTD domain-containing protein [Gemmatimonadota bacterium]MYK53056.1 GWxTD domain-containing protein [Gemmatimonadota bacterium]